MSQWDFLPANYDSTFFQCPLCCLSPFFPPTQILSLLIGVLYYPPLLSLSCLFVRFFLSEGFSFVLSLHFTILLSSFPQVLLEYTFTEKGIVCVKIKHT